MCEGLGNIIECRNYFGMQETDVSRDNYIHICRGYLYSVVDIKILKIIFHALHIQNFQDSDRV
jgi:hypothetical protein